MKNMFMYVVCGTACLVLLGFWLYGRYLAKGFKGIHTIPTRPVFSYWEWLMRAYRQESTREFILRIMCAACIGFSRFKLCMLWIGIRPVVLFYKPDMVEALLNNSKTISKSVEYRFLEPWLGTGLLTSTSDKWRSHRKLLTPSFHFQILETFQATFNREAAVLVDKLTRAMKGSHPPAWTDVVPTVTLCTLDTICQTAMGVHLDLQSGRCMDYVERIDQISDAFFYRVFRPWLWSDRVFFNWSSVGRQFRRNVSAVQDFTKKVIKDKKESMLRELESGDAPPGGKRGKKAFLELLLELHLRNEATFTEENVREEVDTFMFEGHDTTAMSISFTLYLLGLNPEIQDRVHRELDGIFGEDERHREVNVEDLKAMKYLECAIKESLRLYPSVAFIARKLTETLEIDDCITIPPGCTCFVCVYMLHRDPEQFPRPEVFDPDRFLPDNGCDRHPYCYIPFSAGPRNCIGQRFAMMEEKTVLCYLLRRFKVTSLDHRDRVRTMAGLILKNLDPIRIRFDLR